MKVIIKTNGKDTTKKIKKINNITKLIARISILVIAVVLIIDGINNGGISDVFYKAVNICTISKDLLSFLGQFQILSFSWQIVELG